MDQTSSKRLTLAERLNIRFGGLLQVHPKKNVAENLTSPPTMDRCPARRRIVPVAGTIAEGGFALTIAFGRQDAFRGVLDFPSRCTRYST
jgi:hypothetical protein